MGYLVERLLWPVHGEATNYLRRSLGLTAHTPSSYAHSLRKLPTIQGFSQYVVPHVWGEPVYTTGYWFLDEPWQPPDDLTRFLDNGEPPIYIGFGSMSSHNPQEMVIEALAKVGQRAVIARGWGKTAVATVPEQVCVVDKVPHGWLFSRMAGVVHHGGAGTTAAGLRAGVPSFIIPHMADQPYWGRRVHELGVGSKPIPRHKLRVDSLANGIHQLVADSRMKAAATRLGEQISAEDGVGNAVQIIERLASKT
jgi:UDP:flavonoid glycosyltransferase YjiC (YdhE family)